MKRMNGYLERQEFTQNKHERLQRTDFVNKRNYELKMIGIHDISIDNARKLKRLAEVEA
jgi:hypothetical protein